MSDIELAEAEILRNGLVGFNKEIAGSYVKPLLDERILSVTKDHIRIRNLVVPRERVVFFHIALTQLRSPFALFPIRQGVNGFTVERVQAARGNDVVDAYRITSNSSDHTSILLTKKLAWELWEVVAFFIPQLSGPVDEPLPKTPTASDDTQVEDDHSSVPQEDNDDDEDEFDDEDDFDDEESEGPITFDYTPFKPEVLNRPDFNQVVSDLLVNTPYALSSFGGNRQSIVNGSEEFVIVSENESEHAEWDEGSEWGEFLTNDLIPALHEWSVETYNNDDESLDDEIEESYDIDGI